MGVGNPFFLGRVDGIRCVCGFVLWCCVYIGHGWLNGRVRRLLAGRWSALYGLWLRSDGLVSGGERCGEARNGWAYIALGVKVVVPIGGKY